MKRQWTNEELIANFTISAKELDLIGDSKTDHNLLGAACLLMYFQHEGRFPDQKQDIPPIVIVHLAQQLGVIPEKIIPYDWEGRTIKAHRAAIRTFLGVHEATLSDEDAVVEWLCQEVVAEKRQEEALIASLYTRCKGQLIDPPTPDRVRRLVHTAIHRFDERLCASIMQQLSQETRTRLDALLTVEFPETQAREEMVSALEEAAGSAGTAEASQEGEPPRPQSALHALKQDVGPLSLERVLHEIAKLECIHQLGLPADLFAHVSAKTLDSYRNRIAVEDLQEVRRHPDPIRFTLLAGYCWHRRQEIVDILVQLLLDMAHHLSTKAERRVEKAFVKDIKKVSGKTNLLFRLAEVAVDKPDGTIREVVFPVVSEQTLRDLVKEYKAGGSTYQQQVQKAMRGPYSKHYRRMLPAILKHLAFCSNNEVHQPIIQALELLRKYIDVPLTQPHFASTETIPLDEIVPTSWRKAVVTQDNVGKTEQVSRLNYELCVLHTLREKVRSKEVWVQHASRFRNPDDDLPTDFARKRTTYYEALQLPLGADTYIQRLQAEMTTALEQLDQNIPDNHYVRLLSKGGGRISLSPLPPQPQPQHLRLLKAELGTRWSMVELLDILKETDLRVRFTDRFKSPTVREHLERATIQKRLLLALYGLGTNIGLKRVCAGDHGESYRDVLYTCYRFLTKDALRAAIADVANAIFRIRQPDIWGEGTTACASDSKKYSAWDQNLMTEWHARYRGPGVLIYWHVERKAVCIYSQLKRCSSSEVAAMITGLLRHASEMQVERNYVDTHGQSELGIAFCSLLGFQLLPRLKNLHAQKLYRPETGHPDAYPNLQPVLTRPIKWELIRQQYDEMVKFATALRLGTAEAEEILRRFTRNGVQHPTYSALLELGKVQRTIFLCHYLSSEELRREIQEGLNVVENWNSATNFIHFGRHGEFATNKVEDQELAMLALHLLQISLTFIQTLMIQEGGATFLPPDFGGQKCRDPIISGRALSIRIEPLGPEGEGVEFWLQRRTDKREYHQVKRQHSEDGRWTLPVLNSRSVLAHFRKKLYANSAASCVFVSMHAAYQLEELADRARRSASWHEFHETCLGAAEWAKDFESLCAFWDRCSEQEAYEALQRIEVETISENRLRRTVESHLDLLVERDPVHRSEGDAATAIDILAQFALERVHHTLTAFDIWRRLEERGYRRRDWGDDPGVVASAKRVTERYISQQRSTLIAGKSLHRRETDAILQTLLSSNDRQGVLLAAAAGAGKSGVLLQVVEAIHDHGWPVLAFRVDRLEPVLDPADIGRQLKLPGSPITVLAAVAQGRDCALVLDQLDAVSTTSGRNPQFFDCIETLIQQAQTHPRMRIILACRKFDLENDYRLRALAGQDGIAATFPLGPLDQATVKRIVQELGVNADRLTQKQIALLSNPFHLSLLAGIAHTSPTNALSFQTARDLYYQFWDAKETAVAQRLGYPVPWAQIMDRLASAMSERQRLFVAESALDEFRPAVKAMVSEHVLVQQGGQYAFFHESFFDYVFARRFAAQGRLLVPFLCESEQHLFRRAQVRQILLHEREADRDRYLDDLQALLTSPAIRFHLKQIVLALLMEFTDPTEEEWAVVAPFLEETADPCSQEIWRKVQFSVPWFQLLDALGLIERWLASGNDGRIEQIVLLLAHAQGQLPDRVAELVEPYLKEEAWRSRFIYLLQRANLGTGRRFFELFLRCVECGWLDEAKEALASHRSLFWTLLSSLPAQQPEWACEAIGRYFDRCLQRSALYGETDPFDHRLSIVPYTFHGNTALIESATVAPMAFYRQVFPFMCMIMGLNVKREGDPPRQDTVWGRMQRHYGGGDGASAALLRAMERALSRVAAEHPEDFEPIAFLLQHLDFETAHYLLLRGYSANGARFADAAADYLCRPTTNLAMGYGGDAHRVTRELIEAITPYCSERAFARLEQRLLHYYTSYERSARSYKHRTYFGQPTLFGYAQLELLEGVAPFRRTGAMTRRIAEWRRKFPDEIRESPLSHVGVWGSSIVGSPIPDTAVAKMTDEQWLRAIAHHHHDLPQMQRGGALVGGVLRVSSQLERRVKDDPARFAALAQAFPDDAHAGYFDAVLRGIAESPLDMQAVLEVCKRCHALPNKPCGYWICAAIARKAELPLPREALDMVAWYAVEGAQPDHEEWRASLEESLDRRTDPITAAGSSSVRGNAAEVMAHLIYQDGGRISFFLPTLERMVDNSSIPVRSCVSLALRAVLKYDREMALSLFSRLCETEDVLLQASSVEHFIAPALHTHFATLEPILQRMLQSNVPGVTRVGARLASVASLISEQARPLVERCLSGSEAQRIGAAEIFTLHLRLAGFRAFCEQALRWLFNDPSEKVRDQVATCFNECEGEQLGEYGELMKAFVQSQTFTANPYSFIHALENTTAKLPEITCLACEALFGMMCESDLNLYGQSMVRPDAVGKLLLRVYSQQRDRDLQTRCLDLIDSMLQFGEYSLTQVLSEYDR